MLWLVPLFSTISHLEKRCKADATRLPFSSLFQSFFGTSNFFKTNYPLVLLFNHLYTSSWQRILRLGKSNICLPFQEVIFLNFCIIFHPGVHPDADGGHNKASCQLAYMTDIYHLGHFLQVESQISINHLHTSNPLNELTSVTVIQFEK